MSDDETAFNDYLEKVNHDSKKIFNLFSSARIYKVPEGLRKLNESAYIPRIIAIGPLHRNEKHLQTPMRSIKRYYINCLFDRLTESSQQLKQCLNKMKEKKFVGEVKKFYAEEFTVNDDDLWNKTNEKEFVDKAKKYYTEEVAVSDAAELNKTKEKEFVDKAKKYYDKEVMMTVNDDDLSEMMLEDGCFILEVLYASHTNGDSKMAFPQPVTGGEDGSSGSGGEKQYVDPILYNILSANIIKQDLILLENQIPYFVLEQLFELTVAKIPDGNMKLSLEQYVLFFFSEYFSEVENCGSKTKTCSCFPKDCVLWVSGQSKEIERETERLKDDKRKDYFHILHLLQDRLEDCYIPGDLGENFIRINSTKFSEFKVSAADLHNAGVEFLSHPSRVYVTDTEGISWRFSGIQFYFPGLVIHERTEVFLRNLIAFEQCNDPNIQKKFTSYAKVMSMLINSEKDVQVFKDAGIIHNYLGTDKDVPDLFDKLCEGVTVQGDLYLDVWQVAIKYYKRRFFLPRNMRYWTRLIFTSTWGVVAFALGIITSMITVAQFVRDFRK